jgi:FlaA1/EpsC-like NDP-sugar epimerase
MRKVLIYGAGEAGAMVLDEIKKRPVENISVLGFIDDDTTKSGICIGGARVLGGYPVLQETIRERRVNEVIIAMPSIEKQVIKRIVRVCRSEKVKLLIVPSTREIIEGTVRFHQLKEVDPSDLLVREEVEIEEDRIGRDIESKTILITGAAGSIGSVLVKKVLRFNPYRVIALDNNENALFYLLRELEWSDGHMHTPVVPVVSDIKDRRLIEALFEEYKPEIIFHAAAYKHVPLMEKNVRMIYLNNVIGTYNLLSFALVYDVKRFIGISTDKAVYPVSVMGKTKRACEILVQTFFQKGLDAGSVRFGNVLGSNGSVVTVFERQINRGGPLTITSPAMSRYFMTVGEATNLVLQAATMSSRGGVFVLDMGQPILIKDLAESLIILAGMTPGIDIEIRYTGVRPGEKIKEQLFYRDKTVQKVFNGIYIEEDGIIDMPIIERIESSSTFIHSLTDTEVLRIINEIIQPYSTSTSFLKNSR